MDEIYLAESTFKLIRKRREIISDNLMNGSVKDMEHYKFLMGSLDGLNYIEQELKGLLEKQEQNYD
jgi:hypothetical protein|tara:strand:+ start:2675 stop:2872 length:198 start_codon:yes stop_codon:yes gene_type:complete